MNKKHIKISIIILIGILLVLCLSSLIYLVIRFYQYRNLFHATQTQLSKAYQEETGMEDIDANQFINVFTYPRTPVEKEDYKVILPFDLNYYRMLNGERQIIYILSKGSAITVSLTDESVESMGRGVFSLPSEEKGWRYARPFMMEGSPETNDEYYYVRLEDLEKVVKETIKQNPELNRNKGLEGFIYRRGLLRYIDRLFYTKGIVFSKDFSIWDMIYLK